jgi:hypothetical protein
MTNPESVKETLDIRLKKVELIKKIDDTKISKAEGYLNIEKKKLENVKINQDIEQAKKKMGHSLFGGPVTELLSVACAIYVDNDKTIGSEPAIRSLWNDDELKQIKELILEKIKTI